MYIYIYVHTYIYTNITHIHIRTHTHTHTHAQNVCTATEKDAGRTALSDFMSEFFASSNAATLYHTPTPAHTPSRTPQPQRSSGPQQVEILKSQLPTGFTTQNKYKPGF